MNVPDSPHDAPRHHSERSSPHRPVNPGKGVELELESEKPKLSPSLGGIDDAGRVLVKQLAPDGIEGR